MPYVLSVERIARQEGLQEGRQEGESLLIVRLLSKRFGDTPMNGYLTDLGEMILLER